MKTLIIGLGNVGAIHGWALSQAGADITHVVRKGSKGKFENGVQMDVLDLRSDSPRNYQAVYLPELVDEVSPESGYQLVVVATNHLQATEAVRQYCDLVPNASFLMFTANWEGTAEIDKLLSRSRYLWGFSVSSGARGEDGVLYANIQESYRIGELDGSHTPRLERIVALFAKAGFSSDIKPNIIEWQWIHHAIDAGVIGTALYEGRLPQPDEGMDVWLLMVRAVKDALAVLEKRGVNVRAYEDTKPFLGFGDEEAAASFRRVLLAMPHYQRIREHSHFKTAPGEMRQFYLDVLTTGEHLGVPMPYLGSLKDRICSID
jgi:2-dehydropantoate 2-reductase